MLKDLCVLVVDDDEDSCALTEIFLRDLGVYAVTASTAAEAMTALRLVRIDAAIIETRLPDATGNMLLGRIRAAGSDAPAIALSSVSGRHDGPAASRATAFEAHLAKPIDVEALEASLVDVLTQRRRAESRLVETLAPMVH